MMKKMDFIDIVRQSSRCHKYYEMLMFKNKKYKH